MFESTNDVLTRFWLNFINYLPVFFGGLIILIVGFLVAALFKKDSLYPPRIFSGRRTFE